MKRLNSFSAGGSARYYAQPRSIAELMSVLEFAYRKGIAVEIIGGGTHILVPDEGIDALVISTKDMRGMTIRGDLITASPGEMLDNIINIAIEHNLIGMEELGGIPGTVAGAMTINASANGKSLSDVFFYGDYLTIDGKIHRRPYYSDSFRKQGSAFGSTEIIIGVALRLQPSKATAEARLRKEKYVEKFFIPPCPRYSGQIFKDPEGMSAAELISKCDLTGENGSKAEFSEYDSNCIFTYPGCTADEIKSLILHTRDSVLEKTGIRLELSLDIL